MSHGRPITILGYLVRLTSKLVADQILHQWASAWPPELSGGLPQRSARDLSLQQLITIENAKTTRTAWGGWTMDLVKAFNLIPRRVVWFLFQLLGIPEEATCCWFRSLARLTRSLQSGKDLGPPMTSTTGLPEGDSLSVVGMLSLSFVFHQKLHSPQLRPYAYADNWSFMTASERAAFHAMKTILNLVKELRMVIDFSKSWAWATSN